MGWFGRRKGREGAEGGERDGGGDHVDPVEIDLGMQQEFEAEYQVSRLGELGLTVHLVAQAENPSLGSLTPKHCRVYVHPDDEPRVRAELTSAGLL